MTARESTPYNGVYGGGGLRPEGLPAFTGSSYTKGWGFH